MKGRRGMGTQTKYTRNINSVHRESVRIRLCAYFKITRRYVKTVEMISNCIGNAVILPYLTGSCNHTKFRWEAHISTPLSPVLALESVPCPNKLNACLTKMI
jgi:hypothetical protein